MMASSSCRESEEKETRTETEDPIPEPPSGSATVIAHPTTCSEDDGPPPVMVSGKPSNQTNPLTKGFVTGQGRIYDETKPNDKRTYTTMLQNVPPLQSSTVRDDSGIGVGIQHPVEPPGLIVKFHQNGDQISGVISVVPNIHKHVKANPGRFGIAFLCVSTGSSDAEDYIENCTAMEKMKECLGEKLGYLTIDVGMNITTGQLDSLIDQVKQLKLPESYQRVIVYFFGHGNDNSVKLADGYVERKHIISKFQLICPPESDVFKIFIFDSCRMVKAITCEAVQESLEQKALTGGEAWKSKGTYPESTNTLVINATDCNSKAYYRVKNGCGLMTQFFTELAPTRNVSFHDLLVAMRQMIIAHTTSERMQILVYEDKLMGTVNLLAESQGTARVVPRNVSVSPFTLSTNVHWRFADNVQGNLKRFQIEVTSDTHIIQRNTSPPLDRMTTISGLVAGSTYNVQVIAVYQDDTVAKSDMVEFKTPVRKPPSNIVVTAEYPGSPSGKVEWLFSGESSDLSHFCVVIQADGEMEACSKDVPSGKRGTVVQGLFPTGTHKFTVVAVYQDGIKEECSTDYVHSDRSHPAGIEISPDFSGSPNASLTWSFDGVTSDLSQFSITVEVEGEEILNEIVRNDERGVTLRNLRPSTKHTVSVSALYSDGIQKSTSVEFTHSDRSHPIDVKLIQDIPGSNQATIEWSFLENATSILSQFLIIIKEKERVVCQKSVASQERRVSIDCLRPSTKYTVIVRADYKDNISVASETEHTNCELKAASIRSKRLIRVNPPNSVYKVMWCYNDCEPLLAVDHFQVSATPIPSDGMEQRDINTVTIRIDDSERRAVELELQPGTTYSLSIETHFKGNIEPQKSKEVTQVTSPKEEEVRPDIEVHTKQTTVSVTVYDPLYLLNDDCNHLQLRGLKYAIREVQQDGNDDPNKSEQGTGSDFSDLKRDSKRTASTSSTPQPHYGRVDGLKPGRKYKLKLRADYGTEHSVETREIEFETEQYTGIQKITYSCCFVSVFTFSLFLFILSALFISSYVVYAVRLQSNRDCNAEYILTNDSVQCGTVNSLRYERMDIGGVLKSGDTLQGVLQAWLVRNDNLKLYTQSIQPYIYGGYLPDHEHILLSGLTTYTWKSSIIYGYCCIYNNGTTAKTAYLYIFLNDDDVVNFMNGEGAKNEILSDQITIPANEQRCFNKWGNSSPLTVTRSSYHFIGVDIPANTTYSSNITLLQAYVETSDYGTPHYFSYDNFTHFPVPGGFLSRNEYIAICRAPLSIYKTKQVSPASQIGAESAHILSCKEPYHWMKPTFPSLLGIGSLFIIFSAILFVVTCIYWYKYRDRLLNCCKCTKQPTGYEPIHSSIQ